MVTPPDADGVEDYGWWGQALGPNGPLSVATMLGSSGYSWSFTASSVGAVLAPPYFDGRQQLKQNLIFLLQGPASLIFHSNMQLQIVTATQSIPLRFQPTMCIPIFMEALIWWKPFCLSDRITYTGILSMI